MKDQFEQGEKNDAAHVNEGGEAHATPEAKSEANPQDSQDGHGGGSEDHELENERLDIRTPRAARG